MKTKKRKRKTIPFDERAYHPRSGRRRAREQQSALRMRAGKKAHFIDVQGNRQDRKWSAIFMEDDSVNSKINTAVNEKFKNKISKINSHTPIKKVTRVNPATKSPLMAISQSGRTLHRIEKLDKKLVLFSNDEKYANKRTVKANIPQTTAASFKKSKPYKNIRKPTSQTKEVSVKLTAASISKVKKQYKENAYRREGKSQQAVMSINTKARKPENNATNYVRAAGILPEDHKCEWLHCVAYSLIGKDSQAIDNLVAGSFHANTNMMMIEDSLGYLVKQYKNGVTLTVNVDLIPETHIARTIQYKIETPDETMIFDFDAQQNFKSHIVKHDYVKAYVQAKVEARQEENQKKRKRSDSSLADSASFFQKKDANADKNNLDKQPGSSKRRRYT